MISETYKKNISVFIFNENIYMARAIKDRLAASEYDVHFYTDENLVRQSVYLALPHIVILPSAQRFEKLLMDIRKMSREIQILVLAPEEDYEGVLALKRKGFINDFIVDPLKYLDSIPYRVDLACERWVLMSQMEEQQSQVARPTETFIEKVPLFSSNMPQVDLSQDSILSAILSADTDEQAIRTTLERLSAMSGKSFAYFEYNSIRDLIALSDVSFGMRKDLEGLGISLSDMENALEFLEKPMEYKIFTDFIHEVFAAKDAHSIVVKTGDEIHGLCVALATLTSESEQIVQRCVNGLAIKIDNVKKTRTIHNYLQVDREFACFNNKVFYNKISDEISRSRRLNLPLSLVAIDIASQKRTDQKYASSVVAKILKRFTRVTDVVGKVGSYRFGVLLPHCSMEDGIAKARRLQAIVKAAMEENKISSAVVRAGITTYPDQHADAMSLLDAAERACALADGFDVCMVENTEDTMGLRDRIKDRIKGASL